MKKTKGILGCVMAFIYAIIIQVIVVFIASAVYGVIKGISLGAQGAAVEEIAASIVSPSFLLVVQSIASMVTFGVFALWYYLRLANKRRPSVKEVLAGRSLLWISLVAIGAQLAIVVIMQGLIPIFPKTFEKYETHIGMLEIGMSFISFILVVFIAPISEEFIFRAVILAKAKKIMSFTAANILQSVLFGIMHGNIIQGVYAFALGLLIGFVYEKRQSIIVPIILHMIFNLSSVIISTIPDSFFQTYKYAGISLLLLAIIISIPAIIIGLKKLIENPIISQDETNEEDIQGQQEALSGFQGIE